MRGKSVFEAGQAIMDRVRARYTAAEGAHTVIED